MIVSVGDLLADVVCRLEQPLRRGTDAFSSTTFRRGGSAANVAAFAAVGGFASRFVGAVGDDVLGRQLTSDLSALGVDVCAPIVSGRSTGTVIVLVEPDGERTMAPDRGASAFLGPPDRSWLVGASVIHVPLYAFAVEPLATTAATLINWAHEDGVLVSIDLSSSALLDELGVAEVDALARRLRPSVVFANEQEAPIAGGFALAPTFVHKRGALSVLLWRAGVPAQEVPVDAIDELGDSTGAGDAFAAGFLGALSSGSNINDSTQKGCQLARRILTEPR
jgi:sugar/nucleoside kinase (ribokinase family)